MCRLDEDRAAALASTSPAGYLGELLKKSFRAPKVEAVQALIGR